MLAPGHSLPRVAYCPGFIENSRHTVIKRKRIGLNWNLLILFNEVKSIAEHAEIRHGAIEIAGGGKEF